VGHAARQKTIQQRSVPLCKTGSPCEHLSVAFFHYFFCGTSKVSAARHTVSTHSGIAKIVALRGWANQKQSKQQRDGTYQQFLS
jgi:hypothetical protein